MGIFSTGMSPELKEVLEAEDLDGLLEARSKFRQLDEKDIKRVCSILQKWTCPQAVSNLLFHPFLIPADIRASCLLKGLRDKKNPYYTLASVVGLQGIDPTCFSEDERKVIRDSLISIIKNSNGILSARASLSVCDYLSLEDTPIMFELLNHPEETARHNILCWLIGIMDEKNPNEFVLLARNSNVPEDIKKETIEKFQEHLAKKETGESSSFSTPLYAYIPNLKDAVSL
jgi:hypothetical protein